jgi:hypothetical protein
MIYFRGCYANPKPDLGWIASHEPDYRITYCSVREEEVLEAHYMVHWADGSFFRTTHAELEAEDFIILEDTCK